MILQKFMQYLSMQYHTCENVNASFSEQLVQEQDAL